jgi:RNA polymerase sigma-70 factor (ECF subfamily)
LPDHRCGELLETLSLYLDHEASQSVCEELERHLAGCVDCRTVLKTLEKTIALYRGTAVEQALPDDVRRRLSAILGLSGPDDRPGAPPVSG